MRYYEKINQLLKSNLPPDWHKTLGYTDKDIAIRDILLNNLVLTEILIDDYIRIKELQEVALPNLRFNEN